MLDERDAPTGLVGRVSKWLVDWLFRFEKYLDRFDGADTGLFSPGGHWRVIYSDGKVSRVMRHGNAVDYAELFGGRVVHYKDAL